MNGVMNPVMYVLERAVSRGTKKAAVGFDLRRRAWAGSGCLHDRDDLAGRRSPEQSGPELAMVCRQNQACVSATMAMAADVYFSSFLVFIICR